MTGYVAPCLDKAPDLVATSLSRGSGIILFLLLLRSDINSFRSRSAAKAKLALMSSRVSSGKSSRVLERQKMLQTGQVLFRRLSVDFALVLPFKDSSEAAEPRCSTPIATKLPDTPRRSEAPPR